MRRRHRAPQDGPRSGTSSVDAVDLAVEARHQPRSAGRLWELVRHSVRITWHAGPGLFVATVVLQLGTALVLASQVLVVQAVLQALVDVTTGAATIGNALVPVVLLAGVSATVAVTGALLASQQRLLGELVTRATWRQLLDVAAAVELRSFESAEFHDQLQRVQTNALSRPFALTRGLVGLIGGVSAAIALSVTVVALEPLLLPLMLLSGVPMLVTTRMHSRAEFDFAVAQTPRLRLRDYLALVQTGREEAKEVRAFDLGSTFRRRFERVYSDYVDDLRNHVRRRAGLTALSGIFSATFLAIALVAVVWLVGTGTVTLPAAGAALVAIRALSTQITATFRSVQHVLESGLFLDDLRRFTELGSGAVSDQAGLPAPDGFSHLRADHVGFTYPGSTTPAVQDVSLDLRRGEVVALVGENGSGKSTLAKMLAALYDPTAGTISWDGVDVTRYERTGLRESVAVVFQDFVRYHLTAADNIGLGRVDRLDDLAGIAAAAERVGAADAIRRLPAGYSTTLSKLFTGGHDLSGGQWQRVALARAFFRDAPLVILDEPSSALDPRAEHDLFASVQELLAGHSVLFVSHRFSTVRNADRIYVMDHGRVVEQGSHDELMARDGRYAELFRLQAAAYLPEPT